MDFKLSVCGYETKHKDKIILYSVTCAIRHPVTSEKYLWSQSISVN